MLKAVILAAGKGTRMESDLAKVLHEVLGKPMVFYVIDALRAAGVKDICLVVGHQAELVTKRVDAMYRRIPDVNISYAMQNEQLGTGHAVKCAADFIGDEGDVLVLNGDTPLIQDSTILHMVKAHKASKNKATLLSAIVDDASGYGRIIRDAHGEFVKNVEQKDATLHELAVKEINAGMYVFQADALSEGLDSLTNDNAQGEYYLPDVLTFIKNHKKQSVGAVVTEQLDDIRGVNTKEQLKEAEEIMRGRK